MRHFFIAFLFLVGCRGGEVMPDISAGEEEPYRAEFYEILNYLLTEEQVVDGDWQGDFGDASLYGQTELITEGIKRKDPQLIMRGFATANFVMSLIAKAKGDLSFFLDHSDNIMMGTLGLIETYRTYDAASAILKESVLPSKSAIKDAIDDSISMCNELIKGFEYYIALPLDIYDVYTYGNTVVTALFAMLNIEYMIAFGESEKVMPSENLSKIIAAIEKNAYMTDRKFFRYKPDTEQLYLYPNVVMMVIYGKMFRHFKKEEYLEKSMALFEAIQPLKNPAHGGYRSPYSAKIMGAKTDDYSTLSSQNYTVIAMLLLYENSGNPQYLNEAEEGLKFIITHLKKGGQLLHHWMDGEIAKPEHLEYYCPGCNLQFLYVVREYWRLT